MSAPPPLSAGALVRRAFATDANLAIDGPEPIVWIVAANGIWKRGRDGDRHILVRVEELDTPIPGLVSLLPRVYWTAWPRRLPESFLGPLLDDAREAMSDTPVARPIEKQYFVVHRDGGPRLIAPGGQNATPGRVSYVMPTRGVILADIHSHHELPAFFSDTDDRDDTGLSVSVVIGRIFSRPQIACRLNVFGHRQRVPATLIFDGLGPFEDTYERRRIQGTDGPVRVGPPDVGHAARLAEMRGWYADA